MYFIINSGEKKYLSFIEDNIIEKLKLENIIISHLDEVTFKHKYFPFIILNALTQAANISYRDFLLYIIEKEQKIPSAIVIKILENEDVDLIKIIFDKKIIIYEIEYSNIIEHSKFPNVFFQRLDQILETIKIRETNNQLTSKQLVYYLYKSPTITKIKRERIIKELTSIIQMNDNDILVWIIKMKDQDLAEEILLDKEYWFEDSTILNCLLISLKLNLPRISYLLYQFIKNNVKILKNKKIHRSLIRSLTDLPENIEIYLYLAKNLFKHFVVSDIVYLLSVIDQLQFSSHIEDCKYIRVINPLKIFILILELLSLIRIHAYQVKTKCDGVFEKYMKISLFLIEETINTDRNCLEAIFKDKDLEKRELIYIVARNNFFKILQNPIVESIVNKLWNSNYSIQNRFYDTCSILKIINSDTITDIKNDIMNVHERSSSNYKSFYESFVIWRGSIKIKFYIMNIIFVFLLFYMQYLNTQFTTGGIDTINHGIALQTNVSYWLPAMNSYLNTSYSLSNLNQMHDNNSPELEAIINSLPYDIQSNITSILNHVDSLEYESITIRNRIGVINNITYIYFGIIVRNLLKYIYSLITNIKLKVFSLVSLIDFMIFIILIYRIFFVDTQFIALFDINNIDKYNDTYRSQYVLCMSLIYCFLWIKTITLFKFSDKFGPLLRIIEMVIKKLIYFGTIFLLEIFVIACIGNLLFFVNNGDTPFSNLMSSVSYVFNVTMQNYSFEYYDSTNKVRAMILIQFHLIISNIIMLNILIAILSNVYEKIQNTTNILFQQEIILKKKEFLPDKNYGGMLLIPFPFDFIALLFVPFYLCVKSKKKIRKINHIVLNIAYFPMSMSFLLFFLVYKILILPVFILKLLFQLFKEFFRKYNIKQRSKKNMITLEEKIKNCLVCLCIIIGSPLIYVYTLICDIILYMSCLYSNNAEKFYFEEEELLTPFILNKASELFDNYKQAEIACEDIIEDFGALMKLSNEKFDFRNVLLNAYHNESLVLVKEYSIFVKFVYKVKIKNSKDQSVINKNLLTKLMESNMNYCKIYNSLNGTNKRKNKSSFGKIYPVEIESGNSISMLHNSANNSILKENNITETEASFDDVEDIINMQGEIDRNSLWKKNINSFNKLPKLFFKRLYLINLQSVKNSLDNLKNSDNFHHSISRARTDINSIKKTLNKISLVLNTKEEIDKRRKTRLIQRRSTLNIGRFSDIIKRSSVERSSSVIDYKTDTKFNLKRPIFFDKIDEQTKKEDKEDSDSDTNMESNQKKKRN